MPYLKKEQRLQLAAGWTPSNPGDLNYLFTQIIDAYLHRARPHMQGSNEERGGLSYRRINDVIGALECAKLEVYRRVAAPYENTKIVENGDVYDRA